jgi:adenylate cyclase, class 2
MTYEVEQKFPVSDVARLKGALAELHAIVEPPVEQVDQYLAHPGRDFAKTDEALRIRCVGDQNYLTYKGPKLDAETKTRREIELPLEGGKSGFSRSLELFLALGFRAVAQVHKVRQPFELRWMDRTVEVVLDDVAGVGSFVEIELVVGADEVESAKECLASLANRLQLGVSERRSYLEMLLVGSAAGQESSV